MEFKDTVFARRSNRFLLEKPLKKEEIDYILSIAFRAPVALGRYADVKLLVITGNTLMTLQNEFVKVNGNDNTYGGSALIVVLHKGTREELANQDAGIIGEHICLAAADINIGSVYLHSLVDMMNENKFINKDLLDINSENKVMCAVTLGYKANENVRDIEHKFDVKYYN